jgi:hypothetical protein
VGPINSVRTTGAQRQWTLASLSHPHRLSSRERFNRVIMASSQPGSDYPYKNVGIVLAILGIVLIIIGIAAVVYQTCVTDFLGTYCTSPYTGQGIAVGVAGLVILILGAILGELKGPLVSRAPQIVYLTPPAQYPPPAYYPQDRQPSYAPPAPPPPPGAPDRFCESCGGRNAGTSAFCDRCGKPLSPAPP